MKALENLKIKVIVFHFIIVGLFVSTPLVLYLKSDYDPRLLWETIMFSSLAPFYILNVSVLIPQLLNKGKYIKYLLILVLTLIIAYIVLSILFLEFGPPPMNREHRPPGGMGIFPPVMFVLPLIIYYAVGISFESIVESLKQKRSKEEAQKEKVKAELSLLKSQINPHFLFNSLNSIYSLSNSKSELTNDAVLKLSDMMRYMLYESNGEKVPLNKEIEYIENYIALQQYRISKKDNISIRFNYEGEPNGHDVEPLLFIPFVENAFKHGISYNEASIIDIKLSILHDKLTFETLNSCPKNNHLKLDKKNSSGFGLNNIAKRLDLLYPKKYRLRYDKGNDLFSAKLELNLA